MTQSISCIGSKLLPPPFRYEELLLQGSTCLNGAFGLVRKWPRYTIDGFKRWFSGLRVILARPVTLNFDYLVKA